MSFWEGRFLVGRYRVGNRSHSRFFESRYLC